MNIPNFDEARTTINNTMSFPYLNLNFIRHRKTKIVPYQYVWYFRDCFVYFTKIHELFGVCIMRVWLINWWEMIICLLDTKNDSNYYELDQWNDHFSPPSTPAWVIRSAILFSRSSIRVPISSIRVIIWSDIDWNLSWTFWRRFCTWR